MKKDSKARALTDEIGITTPEPDKEQRIREAAYQKARERGFAPGRELDDWLEAEVEINGGQSRK